MGDGTQDHSRQDAAAAGGRTVAFRVGPGPGGTSLGADTMMFPDPLSAERSAARTTFATVPRSAARWRRALSPGELPGAPGRYDVWAAMVFEPGTWFRLQLRAGDPVAERLETVAGQVEVDGSKVSPIYVAVPLGSIDLPRPAGVALEGWAERVAGSGGVSWGQVRLMPAARPEAAAEAWGAIPLLGSPAAAAHPGTVAAPPASAAEAGRAGGRRRLSRGLKATVAAAGVVGAAAAAAGSLTVHATPTGLSGSCTATVAGVDVRSAATPASAIPLDARSTVRVAMRSTAPITGHRVDLEYGGARFTVSKGVDTGSSFSDVVPVDRFARFGVGLYEFVGRTTGPGACRGAAFIKVTGRNPLSTAGGAGAAGGAAIGLAGLLGVALVSARRGGRGRTAIMGAASGLLAAGGVLVLLQQFAVLFPAKALILGALVGGWVLGAVLPLVLTLLFRRGAARAPA